MAVSDYIRRKVRTFLNIENLNMDEYIVIKDVRSLETTYLINEIWYQGDPDQLQQLYQGLMTEVQNTMFWKGTSTTGIDFRKIHVGLPALMIDKIVDISCDDMSDVSISIDGGKNENANATQRWSEIAEQHDFKDAILKEAVRQSALGDCAFKISYDSKISDFPLIEIVPGKRCEYIYKRGRLTGIKFLFSKTIKDKIYVLEEYYTNKGIEYKVFDTNGKELDEGLAKEYWGINKLTSNQEIMMAIPLILNRSSKYPGRGKGLLEGKEGVFDSLDETWSQWMDALRDSRTRVYVPENKVPRKKDTGEIIKPSTFDSRYVATGTDMGEGATNEVKVVSPEIRSDEYLGTHVTALDMALQGIISPSTLGIDVKKLDNAEAQREKEKTTLYTRSNVIQKLEKTIPKLIELVLQVDDLVHGRDKGDYTATVSFGEYANPSFEAQVETIGNARNSMIMSVEQSVEQLYGDTWTKEEKLEEVERLKKEMGIDIDEPRIASIDSEEVDIDEEE